MPLFDPNLKRLIRKISQRWSFSRVTDLSQRKYGDILKTQSAIIKILTFLKCSKNFQYLKIKILNIFKLLKIFLTLREKKYSLRNGTPLKERNKIKFHRSFRTLYTALKKYIVENFQEPFDDKLINKDDSYL